MLIGQVKQLPVNTRSLLTEARCCLTSAKKIHRNKKIGHENGMSFNGNGKTAPTQLFLSWFCLSSQDSLASTTLAWGRRRAWRCCISSEESCIKSCQETQNHSGYQSSVSDSTAANWNWFRGHPSSSLMIYFMYYGWIFLFIFICFLKDTTVVYFQYDFFVCFPAHRIDADT